MRSSAAFVCCWQLRVCTLILLMACAACGASHVRPHDPRNRIYEAGDYGRISEPTSPGSLWPEGGRGLVADFRATQVGDVVTILIDESPNAAGDASTDTKRDSSTSMGASSFLGFAAALQRKHPDIKPEALLDLASSNQFKGDGATSRASKVKAAITVRIKQVLPNGDLYAEGSKILLVNDEELHIYISGVLRPQDINNDNAVRSSMVADAQIEFTGRGVLTDNQRHGWLSRLLSKINPF